MARKSRSSSRPDWPAYLKWRGGRPRWEPGPKLRKAGHIGRDLKDAAGAWLGLEAAMLAASEINARIAADPKPLPKLGVLRGGRTTQDLFDLWLASPKASRKAAATLRDYRNKFRALPADIRAANVAALTKPVMVGLYEQLFRERGHSMANGMIAVLRRVLSYGEQRGWLAVNPARHLEIEQLPPHLRLITPPEAETIVAAADALRESPYGPLASVGDAFVLALHSGQRQSDCLAMPARVLAEDRIRLSQIKTTAKIDAPLTPTARSRLAAALDRQRQQGRLPGTIVAMADGRPWKVDAFRKAWRMVRDAAAAGIVDEAATATRREAWQAVGSTAILRNEPVWLVAPHPSCADVQFKDTRDTAITRLGHAGCTVPQIGAISGHSYQTINTVLRHYMVTTPELADEAIRRLVTWLDEQGIRV